MNIFHLILCFHFYFDGLRGCSVFSVSCSSELNVAKKKQVGGNVFFAGLNRGNYEKEMFEEAELEYSNEDRQGI